MAVLLIVALFPFQVRRTVVTRVHEAVKALALCHNVTPVTEEGDNKNNATRKPRESVTSDESDMESCPTEAEKTVTYQASSPDEVKGWSSVLDLVPVGPYLQGALYVSQEGPLSQR